ncbi:MAG TPA: zinc metallochaperone AztD [Polyangiales bacterium]|nr:zinc metallochaperone AztD [Polyangiales bacterium]
MVSLVLVLSASGCSSDAWAEIYPNLPDIFDPDNNPSEPDAPADPTEVSGPRIVTTHEGGALVLDGSSLAVVDEIPLEGFLRLNPAGDDRHVIVSTGEAFRFLDTGVTIDDHGDHAHYYAVPPELTDLTVSSQKPGHVTHNAGLTALFSDGSGIVELFDPTTLESGTTKFTTYTTAAPHHGLAVALALPEGGLLVTVGTEESRSGAAALDAERQTTASSDECPGVHGETIAQGGVISLGCEDGALLYRDGAFHKAASPDAQGSIGSQVGSTESPIVLGDYNTDHESELARPEHVSLIDTQADSIRVVALGASYSFRSLARGPAGEAFVLGTDGAIHVIDPQLGEVVDRIAVVAAWSEPADWQEPRPALRVVGSKAYVTEPASSRIHLVDLGSGDVVRSVELPYVPNEVSGAAGH